MMQKNRLNKSRRFVSKTSNTISSTNKLNGDKKENNELEHLFKVWFK